MVQTNSVPNDVAMERALASVPSTIMVYDIELIPYRKQMTKDELLEYLQSEVYQE